MVTRRHAARLPVRAHAQGQAPALRDAGRRRRADQADRPRQRRRQRRVVSGRRAPGLRVRGRWPARAGERGGEAEVEAGARHHLGEVSLQRRGIRLRSAPARLRRLGGRLDARPDHRRRFHRRRSRLGAGRQLARVRLGPPRRAGRRRRERSLARRRQGRDAAAAHGHRRAGHAPRVFTGRPLDRLSRATRAQRLRPQRAALRDPVRGPRRRRDLSHGRARSLVRRAARAAPVVSGRALHRRLRGRPRRRRALASGDVRDRAAPAHRRRRAGAQRVLRLRGRSRARLRGQQPGGAGRGLRVPRGRGRRAPADRAESSLDATR